MWIVSQASRCAWWLARHLASSPARAGISAAVLGFAGGLISVNTVMVMTLRHLDSDGYFQIADCLRQGHGFRFWPQDHPETHRPPIFPLICVPFAALPVPVSMPAYLAFQSVLMGLSCALTHRIAARLAGPDVASFAALLFMFHPGLLLCSPTPTPWYWETLVYTGLSWSLIALAQRDPSRWPAMSLGRRLLIGLGLGLLMGVLCLTHGAKLLTVPMIVVGMGLWSVLHRRTELLPSLLIAGVTCAVMIAPWSYRNWVVLGRFVPLATNSGYAFFLGDARWGIGDIDFPPDEPWRLTGLRCAGIPGPVEERVEFWSLRDPQDDWVAEQHMRERIRRRPDLLLAKIGLNAVDQFFPAVRYVYLGAQGLTARSWAEVVANSQFQKALLMTLYNGVLASGALLGIRRGFREFSPPGIGWILLGLMAAFCLPYYPFLVSAQSLFNYTFALLPLLCSLAATAWVGQPSQPTAAHEN